MSDSLDDLCAEAERLLDASEFAGARDAYRNAALAGSLSRDVLANLDIASELERLAFACGLHRRHPTSMEAGLTLAHTLVSVRRFDSAIELCSALLAQHGSDPRTTLQVRSVRLRAAARGRHHHTLVEDARAIWAEGDVDAARRPLRRTVLRAIAEIDRPEAAQAVHSIAAHLDEGPERRFLAAKAAELVALADALKETTRPTAE